MLFGTLFYCIKLSNKGFLLYAAIEGKARPTMPSKWALETRDGLKKIQIISEIVLLLQIRCLFLQKFLRNLGYLLLRHQKR